MKGPFTRRAEQCLSPRAYSLPFALHYVSGDSRERQMRSGHRSNPKGKAMTSPKMTSLKMTTLKTIAAAALLSAVIATPAFSQAAIQEPGAYAFYHPYADVLNGGAPTPAAGLVGNPAALQAYQLRESGLAASHWQTHRRYRVGR